MRPIGFALLTSLPWSVFVNSRPAPLPHHNVAQATPIQAIGGVQLNSGRTDLDLCGSIGPVDTHDHLLSTERPAAAHPRPAHLAILPALGTHLVSGDV